MRSLPVGCGIAAEGNRVQITVSHDKTDAVAWQSAAYDLQMTDGTGRVKTLCSGCVRLPHDITRGV